ncbi:MAG: hypothetical protein K5897_12680 [Eubacterium sp.]|nr:hypothetical protein [Eubacterium sp.]
MKKLTVMLIVFVFAFCFVSTEKAYAKGSGKTDDNASRVDRDGSEVPVDYAYFEDLGIYHVIDAARVEALRIGGHWVNCGNGLWKYLFDDETYATNQWVEISGYWYYFDSNGYMLTGWLEQNGCVYYLNEGTSGQGQMVIGWKQITVNSSTNWYYFNEHGIMATGWKYISYNGVSNWYFFGGNGIMRTGWLNNNGHRYYLKSNGVMVTGWYQVNEYWYFFRPSDGAMVTGWKQIQNKWYFFRPNGAMMTGWKTVSGYSYYFSEADSNLGQLQETTRRAIVVANIRTPNSMELDAWEHSLNNMSFADGSTFGDRIETASAPTYNEFCSMLDDVRSTSKDGDILYLCLSCHGSTNGALRFCSDVNFTGQMLKDKLKLIKGKIVLFINACYAGNIINRGESGPEDVFLEAFIDKTRSGELVDDKYIVLCSSQLSEQSFGYNYWYDNAVDIIQFATRCWTLGGGWDIHNDMSEQMHADANNNSIVTLTELSDYSENHLTDGVPSYVNLENVVQHVVVASSDSNFTIFARMN